MSCEELFKLHEEWARGVAVMYCRRTMAGMADEDDYSVAALWGLWQAAARFDPDKGVPFKSFASCRIYGAMKDWQRTIDPLTRAQRREKDFAVIRWHQLEESKLDPDYSSDPSAGLAIEDAARGADDKRLDEALRYAMNGRTVDEIATIMEVSVTTARKLRDAAIARTRARL